MSFSLDHLKQSQYIHIFWKWYTYSFICIWGCIFVSQMFSSNISSGIMFKMGGGSYFFEQWEQ